MKKMKASEVARILAEHPAFGIKAMEKPFVLVVKTKSGIVVTCQNESLQKTYSIGRAVFPEEILLEAVIDVQIKKNNHVIVLAVSRPQDEGRTDFYIIGESSPTEEDTTVFFAYEAEKDRSVHTISIIEEGVKRSIYSDARRYGKDSAKLLKNTLLMALALCGIDVATRESILKGGTLIPPTTLEEGGVSNE